MKQHRLLTKEQHNYLLEILKGRYNSELADMLNEKFNLNLTRQQIKSYKRNHHLTSGLTGRFKKGHVPTNKGTKGIYNVGGNRTSFKKGHKPINYKPIGTERISKDGYILIKVQDEGLYNKRWRHKARVVWEESNGPIPKGYTTIFKDGNPLNCRLENILLITRNELFRVNNLKINRTSEEMTDIALNLARISIRKSEIKRRHKSER